MKELLRAFTILASYPQLNYPTNCYDGTLRVFIDCQVDQVSEEHIKELEELGFYYDEGIECFESTKYGSN